MTVQTEDVSGFLGRPSPKQPNLASAGIEAGPAITDITKWVTDARNNRDLTLGAVVRPRAFPIASVHLIAQFGLGAPARFDMAENNGRYEAVIPHRFLHRGDLVRWSVMAIDESGRSTIEPPLDQTRYGAGIDANSTDNVLFGHTFESHPHELQQEGASETMVWLDGEIIRHGWLVDRRSRDQAKPNLILASGDGETLNFEKTEGVRSQLLDLMAPVDDPTGARALIANQLERDLVGSGPVLKPLVLRRNGEFYGLFQSEARIGWGTTAHLGGR